MTGHKANQPRLAADVRSLQEFLFGQEGRFYVPEYQREYSWDRAQLEPFWDDLIAPGDEPPEGRFAGTILLLALGDGSFEVVDGQQRLLTATLALCAIRDAAATGGHSQLAQLIQRQEIQIEDPSTGELVDMRFSPGQSARDFVQINYQMPQGASGTGATREERRIAKAYRFFAEQLELALGTSTASTRDTLQSIRSKIRRLSVVRILLYDDAIKFEVFESVNARGINLSPADLVKNHLVGTSPERSSEISRRWAELAGRADDAGMTFTDCIRYDWIGWTKFVSAKDLFASIRNEVRTVSTAREYLDRLSVSVGHLSAIRSGGRPVRPGAKAPSRGVDRFDDAIVLLQTMPAIKQPMVIMLAVFRATEIVGAAQTAPLANDVARFTVAHFAVCQGAGNRVERRFARLAQGVSRSLIDHENGSGAAISALRSARRQLAESWPSSKQISAALDDLRFQDDKRTRSSLRALLVLLELDRESSREVAIDWPRAAIDHIHPQNPKSKSERLDEAAVHLLGNLVLLDSRENSALSNAPPALKPDVYMRSRLAATREIGERIQANGWRRQQILEETALRRKRLVELLRKPRIR